jgi:hypothetical protein
MPDEFWGFIDFTCRKTEAAMAKLNIKQERIDQSKEKLKSNSFK